MFVGIVTFTSCLISVQRLYLYRGCNWSCTYLSCVCMYVCMYIYICILAHGRIKEAMYVHVWPWFRARPLLGLKSAMVRINPCMFWGLLICGLGLEPVRVTPCVV